jgi:hypothetical protein
MKKSTLLAAGAVAAVVIGGGTAADLALTGGPAPFAAHGNIELLARRAFMVLTAKASRSGAVTARPSRCCPRAIPSRSRLPGARRR